MPKGDKMRVVNNPKDFIRALTCGMTAHDRERRLLATLRAYVDESGSAGRDGIFVMAGLVAFVMDWEEAAQSWETVLRSGTPVPFFRTASFRSKEWRSEHKLSVDDANSKAESLAQAVRYPPLLFSVCCSVQKTDYREIIADSGVCNKAGKIGKLWLKTPYAYCFNNVISLTLEMIVSKLGIVGDVVDFVFDRNDSLFDASNEMLRELRKVLKPEGWRETLGDAIPGDDRKLLPLQAADLLAGKLKDHCSLPGNADVLKSLLSVSGEGDRNITLHAGPKQLRNLASRIRNQDRALTWVETGGFNPGSYASVQKSS